MTLWLAFDERRIGVVSESIGFMVAASESRIDLAIEVLLDEPTAAGGCLEFRGKAQVLGSPYPESSNAFDADSGAAADVIDVGKTFQSLE
jgi:hypothetical protein